MYVSIVTGLLPTLIILLIIVLLIAILPPPYRSHRDLHSVVRTSSSNCPGNSIAYFYFFSIISQTIMAVSTTCTSVLRCDHRTCSDSPWRCCDRRHACHLCCNSVKIVYTSLCIVPDEFAGVQIVDHWSFTEDEATALRSQILNMVVDKKVTCPLTGRTGSMSHDAFVKMFECLCRHYDQTNERSARVFRRYRGLLSTLEIQKIELTIFGIEALSLF